MSPFRNIVPWLAIVLACSTPHPELFEAVGAHDHDMTRELVASGADLEIRNEGGLTPLMWAVFAVEGRYVRYQSVGCAPGPLVGGME